MGLVPAQLSQLDSLLGAGGRGHQPRGRAIPVRDAVRALFRSRPAEERQGRGGEIGRALYREYRRHRAQGGRIVGRPTRIEGYAIVSEDGMLADPNGHMPDSIKFEADLKFFTEGMDGCDVAIHGRHSHERQPNSPKRHRIWVTGRVKTVEREDSEPRVLLWNPEGASFEEAWDVLGVDGSLGVVGGTTVFGLFL